MTEFWNWQARDTKAPKDREILVYTTSGNVRVVKWDYNDVGYTIPFKTWCVADTMNRETICTSEVLYWCDIVRPM